MPWWICWSQWWDVRTTIIFGCYFLIPVRWYRAAWQNMLRILSKESRHDVWVWSTNFGNDWVWNWAETYCTFHHFIINDISVSPKFTMYTLWKTSSKQSKHSFLILPAFARLPCGLCLWTNAWPRGLSLWLRMCVGSAWTNTTGPGTLRKQALTLCELLLLAWILERVGDLPLEDGGSLLLIWYGSISISW